MSNPTETQTYEQYPPVPPVPPQNAVPPKPKTPFWKKIWVLPVAALLVGLAIGAGDPRTVEVTKEVPVEKIVEKEVEVAVPTTPQGCIDAIDTAVEMFAVQAAVMDIVSGSLNAVANNDVAGIDAATAKMGEQNAELDKLQTPWASAVKECRASAG
jgi:hypothetical protein